MTRDRIEELCEWWVKAKPYSVILVDTGGLNGDLFREEIQSQVNQALKNSDLILFVVDSQTGVLPLDEEVLRELSQSGLRKKLPIFVVVNKVDADLHEGRVGEFYSLGIETVIGLSAEHHRGIEDLKETILDTLVKLHPDRQTFQPQLQAPTQREIRASRSKSKSKEKQKVITETEAGESEDEQIARFETLPRIAIIGKPNVGKSTLLNALLGEERMITSSIAGTTSDSVDSEVVLNGKAFCLVDTAGIRRKGKTEQGIEVLSVVQTRKTLERADIALLVLDGEEGIAEQDEKIGGLIQEMGCSVVLVLNKWDIHARGNFTKEIAAERIRGKMAYLNYAPLVFVSALREEGLDGLGGLFEEILEQRKVKVATHEFTEWVRQQSTIHNPQNAKFFLCHQTGRHPPTFVCHVNDPDKVHFSLRRHFVNKMRERWGYMGTPIRILFVEAKNRRSLPKKVPKVAPLQKKPKNMPAVSKSK